MSRLLSLLTALAIPAVIVAYATLFFPLLDRIAPGFEVEHVQPAEAVVLHKDRPNLGKCFESLVQYEEDPFCTQFGGYAHVFQQVCAEQASCYEKLIRNQQRCVDRPKSCYRFLEAKP